MPIGSEDARIQAISKAKIVEDRKPDAERVRLAWKTGEQTATVVTIPLAAVVLNPRSHRIRAQLESHPRRDVVERDPFSEEAQGVISKLLRETERFEELKNNLKEVGQLDPGVVTHTGLLVNANTRCVALRDIDERYIRVAVLDEDAPDEEINRLELRLQMKRDFRRNYTFTNELLFIEELIKKFRFKPTEIAWEMGWAARSDINGLKRAAEKVQQSLRMLTLVRETQDLTGKKLPLTEFDSAAQAILEIDEDYERLKKRAPEGAANLRDTRLVAFLSRVGYRELREINESFLEEYLAPSMDEQPLFKGRVEHVLRARESDAIQDLPGLEVLETDLVSSPTVARTANPLLTLLAESTGRDKVVIKDSSGASVEFARKEFVEELKQAIESAAEDAKIARQQGNLVDRPMASARKAAKHLRAAIEAYRRAKDAPGFFKEGFRTALEGLRNTADAMVNELQGE